MSELTSCWSSMYSSTLAIFSSSSAGNVTSNQPTDRPTWWIWQLLQLNSRKNIFQGRVLKVDKQSMFEEVDIGFQLMDGQLPPLIVAAAKLSHFPMPVLMTLDHCTVKRRIFQKYFFFKSIYLRVYKFIHTKTDKKTYLMGRLYHNFSQVRSDPKTQK